MNKSQKRSGLGMWAAIISASAIGILPLIQQLPPGLRAYGPFVAMLCVIAGAYTSANNQSRSSEHVSIPKWKADRLGVTDQSK